jgi:predicted metalloprotease with PDZ domain
MVRTEMIPDQHSLVLDDGDYLKPTLSDPYELYVVGHTITASLWGAQLVDPDTNAVIAAFAFKGGPGAQSPPAASKDHAVLGVLLAPVTPALVAALSLPSTEGAMVSSVAAGGTADKAGIKVGDILLKIGDTTLKGPLDVGTAISTVPVGSSLPISLIHQGAPAQVRVTF